MDFVVGQRVTLAADASLSDAVMIMHADDSATVLRRRDRDGGVRYLIRFDRTDAVYGMYWVTGRQLVASDEPVAASAG
jgi:hypothetical protein